MRAQVKFSFLTLLIVIVVVACSAPQPDQSGNVRHRIASAYGSESFHRIEVIEYTFNVQIGDKHIKRSWIWWPQVEQVEFKGGADQEPMLYNRLELGQNSPQDEKQVDAWFINDNYWLLFPFHLAWDQQATVEDTGHRDLPMGQGTAKCVVVSYPKTGGYTAGDVYELFVDENHMLTQWVYRRGGSATPTRITTWEEHRKLGPLMVSLNHHGDDGKFRVWFTDVAVKLHGSFDKIEAE
jgi:hypothetical protein